MTYRARVIHQEPGLTVLQIQRSESSLLRIKVETPLTSLTFRLETPHRLTPETMQPILEMLRKTMSAVNSQAQAISMKTL